MHVTSIRLFDDDVHALTCSRDRSFLCWDLRRSAFRTTRSAWYQQHCAVKGPDQVVRQGQERLLLGSQTTKANAGGGPPAWRGLASPSPTLGSSLPQLGLTNCPAVGLCSGELFKKASALKCGRKCAFSPDDRQLVSVGEDSCVFVWNCT